VKIANFIHEGKLIGFVAREANGCTGCLFDGCRSAVCMEAAHQAQRAGQPDCDDKAPAGGNYVYVEADPRQAELLEGV
jgi:hypothetical protein